MEIHICKLPISDSDCFCTLQSEWDSTEIRIFVLHENKGWSGKLGKEEHLEELLDQLSISEEKYMEETKNALTTNGGLENFIYSMDGNKFTWKKCMRKNMVVKFGYIGISEASINTYQIHLDSALKLNIELAGKLSNSTHQKEVLSSENSVLKDKISELTTKKIEMEETLYNQFLYLLNEKKKKIVELTRKMDAQGCNEDTLDSDIDPFDTDTELESDEGENTSPSKVVSLETRNSLDEEDFNLGTLPKKTRREQHPTDDAPGPSGISVGLKSPKLNNDKTSLTPERRSRCRKPPLFGDLEKESSEKEDPFAFPKRSKRAQKDLKLDTSSKKVQYDCDNESPVDKIVKIEEDSDRTPPKKSKRAQIDLKLDTPSKTVKYESDNESPVDKTVKIEEDSDRTPSELDFDDNEVKSNKSDDSKSSEQEKSEKEADLAPSLNGYEGLSSPTRAMLDRLM